LNLYTQGVHPGLDFSDLPRIREVYERTTRMEVHPRHPYAGDLVFTAFSGSHQDAIKKSWALQAPNTPWDVLYIPIDPADIGRNYKAIIRINSQSGKGGVAYVLEQEFGYQLPKLMHKEIGRTINELADATGRELTPQEIHDAFVRDYIDRTSPVALGEFRTIERGSTVTCQAELTVHGRSLVVSGTGNGPIDAFVHALREAGLPPFELLSYSEHSLGSGAQARAVSYIQIKAASGHAFFGAGIDTNIELASIKAIVSALNRALGS
jgi:2-isopropylmalate synthase